MPVPARRRVRAVAQSGCASRVFRTPLSNALANGPRTHRRAESSASREREQSPLRVVRCGFACGLQCHASVVLHAPIRCTRAVARWAGSASRVPRAQPLGLCPSLHLTMQVAHPRSVSRLTRYTRPTPTPSNPRRRARAGADSGDRTASKLGGAHQDAAAATVGGPGGVLAGAMQCWAHGGTASEAARRSGQRAWPGSRLASTTKASTTHPPHPLPPRLKSQTTRQSNLCAPAHTTRLAR